MTTAAAKAQSRLRFTDEQRRALETREVSLGVSAGAGCGKTFVLTQRFLAHFDPANPDSLGSENIGRLVAITFTNAAAREMRDRVRRACYERLRSAGNDDEADYWSGMIRSLDGARISTIDSFCSSLLRTHAVEAGLDPQFTLLEPAQAGSLLAEHTDDVLRAALAAHDPVMLDLCVRFGLDGVRNLVRLLAGHRDANQLADWKDRSPEEQVARWAELHRQQIIPTTMRRVTESDAARRLFELLDNTVPGDPTVQAQRTAILQILRAWREATTVSGDAAADLKTLRETAQIKKRSPTTWPSPEDYAAFRDLCKELREKVIDKLSAALAFDPQAALPAARAGLEVLGLALRVAQGYAEEKQSRAVLDFRDLLVRTHALLNSPDHRELRRRLADQIELLLVDEFQDTDSLQVGLIEALCGDALHSGRLFFVGDYKQSIYRFRGADPLVFRQLRERLPAAGQLPLTLNFRSQPAILNFVNALFDGTLGAGYEPLRAHRQQIAAPPTIEFLWALSEEPAEVKESQDELRRREADWIARRLRALIDSQTPIVWDTAVAGPVPSARAVQPRDVAILFRALSDVAYYEEALRRHGLDYYLVGGHAFYAQQEIFDLVNLLRAVNDPADVVSLAGVLRSPFFCLADEALFWLAQHPQGLAGGLFAADHSAELAVDQRRRAAFAAATLQTLRDCKDRVSIVELIRLALSRTGYDALLLTEFLGERKLANLRKLIDQARRFEQGGTFNLGDFIAELADHVAEQPKEALAATHAADTNVIRLMSIHQAKGLEFPVVVVADIDRSVQARSAPVEFSGQLGPLVRLPEQGDQPQPADGHKLFHTLADEEDLAEVRRLLYVAATRAADYLILSAGLSNLDKPQGPWTKLLGSRFDLETGNYIGPRLPEAQTPQVAVIRKRPSCGSAEQQASRPDWPQLIERAAEMAKDPTSSTLRLVDPVPLAAHERREFSFSRLSGALVARSRTAADSPEDESDPIGEARAAIDPRGLGTLAHAVLAEIRFGQPVNLAGLIDRHAERHVVPGGDDARLAAGMISRFLGSPRAQQLAAAKNDFAELEFLVAWPPGGNSADGSRLTGFIDRLYQDQAGAWHILDFKTNRIDGRTLASVTASYELQMLVYALAAEQVLGQPPKTLTLHMLRTGDEQAFEWNDAARTKVRSQLDLAIGQLRQPLGAAAAFTA